MKGARIALIRARYTAFGGAERVVADTLTELAREGADVTLIAREWQSQPGLRAHIVDPPYLTSYGRDKRFARAACRVVARAEFDLVQSHERLTCCDVFRAGDGVHAQWLELRARTQTWPQRVGVALNPHHRWLVATERRLFASPRLKAIICNSHMVADEIRARFGVPREKLRYIPNGVNLERFHPRVREAHRGAVRSQWELAPDAMVFVYVGSGFARKGVDVLLHALARAGGGAHALIIGDDKHASHYHALARELGLAARVRFVGPVQDVAPYLGAADAFVLPTLYDPFPNAALEALACGLPVITSTTCGARDVIEHGVNGLLCDALDVDTLAQYLAAFTPTHGEAMRPAARAVAEPFTLSRMRASLLALYAELLGDGLRAQ